MTVLRKLHLYWLWASCILIFVALTPAWGQVVTNGNFEGGFAADGVALGWAGWRDANWTQASFAPGSDHVHSPSYSQKFIAPQPFSILDMGIRQQVNTSSGGVYSFTLWLRTQQGNEAYSGEHLNVFLGLDPDGGLDRYSTSVQWHELSNLRNAWVSETRSVTSRGPWTTVYLKVVRKYPAGGQGLVWVDDVMVTGPPPQIPPTNTPTVTATHTPPTPAGPELVQNGSFEGDYSPAGVAAGWAPWSTAGNGYWKRSTRLGPAGGGSYASPPGWYEDLIALRGKVALLGNGFGAAGPIGNNPDYIDAVIVGRYVFPMEWQEEIYRGDYERVARRLADYYTVEAAFHPRIDAWCGQNEPDWGTDANWRNAILFETRFTQIMHERGMKTVVLNMSVGSPGDMAKILDCRELFEIADYFGYHCYGGPNDQLMIHNVRYDDPNLYALRVRNYQRMYEARGWRFPAVIYTEGTTYHGQLGTLTAGMAGIGAPDIRDDMIAFIPYINADRWALGMTIFCVGGSGAWKAWDITGYGIAAAVGAANMADPVDKTSGLYSQQFGVGTLHCNSGVCAHDGMFTGGVVQQVSGLVTGQPHRLAFDFKWEHANGRAALAFEYGLDWTGQTASANAPSIAWSGDLIQRYNLPADIFRYHYDIFPAQSDRVALWFRSRQNLPAVSVRTSLDSVSLARVGTLPVATLSPTPTFTGATPTPTRTASPTVTQCGARGLTNGDFEAGLAPWVTYGSTDGLRTQAQTGVTPQSGTTMFGALCGWCTKNGGAYQQVPVCTGARCALSAWVYTRQNGGLNWDVNCRVGIDPAGGTNPQSATIVWTEWTNTAGSWQPVGLSGAQAVTAQAAQVTVFVEHQQKFTLQQNLTFIDNVSLTVTGDFPPRPTPRCVCALTGAPGDVDGDNVPDSAEFDADHASPATGSNRYLWDSDGDGLSDGFEDADRNGVRDAGELDPRRRDSDGDGLWDGIEALLLGSDPLQIGSPAPALTDGDRDGLPHTLDPDDAQPDTDNDGYADGLEAVSCGLPSVQNALARPPMGDLDCDGVVSNLDALVIHAIALAMVPHGSQLGEANSDTNRDGFTSNLDTLIIHAWFLRVTPLLPVPLQ